MPRLPVTEQALRSVLPSASSKYVCRSCRARARRQFSISSCQREEQVPFLKRLQKSLFGSEESQEVSKKREDATRKRAEEIAAKGNAVYENYEDEKGRHWRMAPVVDPTINKDYVQATEMFGLEKVGGSEWVKERKDGGEAYIGFNPRRKMELDNGEWRVMLHVVAVEVIAAQQAGIDMDWVTGERELDTAQWTRTAGIRLDEVDGKPSLQYSNPEDQRLLVDSMTPAPAPAIEPPEELAELAVDKLEEAEDINVKESELAASKFGGEEAVMPTVDMAALDVQAKQRMRDTKLALRQMATQHGDMPLSLQLVDPKVKLMILKRVFQLTNHRLPDPVISKATTLSELYYGYITKPIPKKLAQTQALKQLNVKVPNVTVYNNRRTPIDKEKDVGRWKVIEEELLRRNLPVTGSRWPGAKTTSPLA